ncbi:MAG: DNA-protecting protein DprA [Flavobacteriaceae bacterium]|nr:DNA-protecting protein DprA [Flavobacteriaceae bacterium]
MSEQELLAYLALQKVPLVGDVLAKRLLLQFGSARAVFEAASTDWIQVEGFGRQLVSNMSDPVLFSQAESELKFIKDNGVEYHSILSDTYPENLRHCPDGPILLFQKGDIRISTQPIISIVGTRQITARGKDFLEMLIRSLAMYNPVIVSGFAYGADIAAQKAALKNNLQTIGCLAHGFEQIYPKSHLKYVEPIMNHGGFLSDFWSTDTFERNNFLKRNRIIAGLSEATIVIESAAKGGSLVTADIANSYNREVFAVPGRTTDLFSEGCNNLIKRQQAHLISSPEDIPLMLNWREIDSNSEIKELPFPDLDEIEEKIYSYLGIHGRSFIDHISIGCELPSYIVASKLLGLELKNLVKPSVGKFFERV